MGTNGKPPFLNFWPFSPWTLATANFENKKKKRYKKNSTTHKTPLSQHDDQSPVSSHTNFAVRVSVEALKGTKLGPNLSREQVCLCGAGFLPRCHRDSGHAPTDLALLSRFLSHCMYVMWMCEHTRASLRLCMFIQWTFSFSFFLTQILCSNTSDTRQFKKGGI